ncbi:MAG: prenyltransferase/squalene oxidase repeat-containing protein [Phycisphaerales bacterium JB040]
MTPRPARTLTLSLALLASPAPAQDSAPAQPEPAIEEFTDELNAAVARGLAYLATQQDEDGSFDGGRYGKNVAITALACLAFMSDGHMPGRGEYGAIIDRGVDFVLANAAENGLIASDSANGPMYGHGFATLFLGEVYGMTGGASTARSRKIHEAIVKAVRLIERSQNEEGGWRYNPVPYDADVSVTICQVMALRSARNAGIEVAAETIDNAVEYVRNCQNPDGGFKYQLEGGISAWPRTAAGVATLFYAGIYEDESIDRGLEYLKREALPGTGRATPAHRQYGNYYAVQAHFLAGGDAWAAWWPAIRRELLDEQLEDGSWEDRSVGPSYGTSMSLLVLQIPKRYLPIFQK